jgi:hypothetical protein
MDIAGAKALKERLGGRSAEDAAPASPADVREDAPPVYRWVGVRKPASSNPPVGGDDEQAAVGSLFRRLGMSFR